MKKKGINIRTIIVLIAIATLAIVSVFFAVNSYFTAKSTRRGNINMAVLSLDLVNSSGTTLNSNVLTTKFPDPIEQGEKLEVDNIYVKNPTNYDLYCIIKIRLEITKQGETSPSYIKERYTNFNDNEIYIGSTDAETLTSGTSKIGISSIKVPYSLGNSYQGATAQITYKACAVQKAHIPPLDNTSNTEAKYAAEFLTEEYESRDVTISLNGTTTNYNINGVTVSELTVPGVTTDNSCGWYYDEACTRPAYSTDVLTDSCTLYTKSATTDKISGTSNISATSTSITGEVIIPQTVNGTKVTSIAGNAFKDCTGITSVIIPEGVTTINANAFNGCTSLETITIPSTCTSLGGKVFENDTNLRSVVLRSELINISGDGWAPAFSNCSKAIFNQYDNAYYLGNENNLYLACVQAVNQSATSCNIAPTCKFVSSFAFLYAGVRSIVLPEGMIRLYGRAFYGASITSITLPNSMERIDDEALSDTRLQSLHLPANVSYFGYQFMWNGTNIKYLSVDPDNPVYDSRNNCNCIIRTADDYLVMGSMNSVIPNTVKTIGSMSFVKVAIRKIVIPSSVTKIESNVIYQNWTTTYVWIPNSVLNAGAIGRNDNITLKLFCEAASKPAGWSNQSSNTEVYWGQTFADFEAATSS